MMRIAMFMHGGVAPPPSRAEVPAITALVKRLSERFAITVYTVVKPDGRSAAFRLGKAEVRYVRARHDDTIMTRVVAMLRAFREDHRSRRFAIVHGLWALPGGIAAVLAGTLARLPSIVSILGGEAAYLPKIRYGNMRGSAARMATLWTCRHSRVLTALTHYQLENLRLFGFTRTRDVEVIPFGAENSLFLCAEGKKSPPPYHFLNVAHCNGVKDQTTLLKAFQQISRRVEARLRIVGEDTLQGSLVRLAEELAIGDRVEFTGFVPHDELHRHFAWAHMMLHSSLYEGQGVVFAEAAAARVPICGTRVGLLSDEGDSMAATVAPGDYAALAESAVDLVEDRARYEGLSRSARAWSDEHTADWTASRFADVYARLRATHPEGDA